MGVKARGGQALGDPYHDHCHCTPEPVYDRSNSERPFWAEWQQAKRIASEEGLRTDVAFRRLVEGRNAPPSP